MFAGKIFKYSNDALTLDELRKKTDSLIHKRIEERKQRFNEKNRNADLKMEEKLLNGSLQDKIAQMTLMLREDILTFQNFLYDISELIDKNPRTFFQLTTYYFEIQALANPQQPLTPLTSQLKQASPNTFYYPSNDLQLLQINAENLFLDLAFKVLDYSKTSSRSNVPNFRKLALQPLAGLTEIPGFEKVTIKILIEKMGDPDNSGKAITILEQLYKEKNFTQVVFSIFEEFQRQTVYYFKDRNHIAEKIMRQSIIFLGFQLKKEDEKLCLEAVRIIMNFLHEEIKSGNADNQLIQQSLLTMTKVSKIADFRKVEKIDEIVTKLSQLADTVTYQTRAVIINFLVQILFSMQLQDSSFNLNTDSVQKIIDSIINLLLSLPNKLEIQNITPKFYSLMNAIFKLHKITTNGIYSNNLILANIWKKFFNAGLGIENSAVLCNICALYTETTKENLKLRKEFSLKCEYGPNYLFSNENNQYNYKTFYKLSNAEDSQPFEALLMKQHINPSIRQFGNKFTANKFCEMAPLKEGNREQPFGTSSTRRIIEGGTDIIYGTGKEFNSIHLATLKRVIDVKIIGKDKKPKKSDEQIAIESLQKQGILDENCKRIDNTQLLEEQFEGEEEIFEELDEETLNNLMKKMK